MLKLDIASTTDEGNQPLEGLGHNRLLQREEILNAPQ
jgi:hypothetical protein